MKPKQRPYRIKIQTLESLKALTIQEGDCWIWQKSLNHDNWKGYGRINHNGKGWYTHRLVYTLVFGEIPKNKDVEVCHTCDIRRCINPAHLFLGTPKTNTADAIHKNRHSSPRNLIHAAGESNPASKLTTKKVVLIKTLLLKGVPHNEIAKQTASSRRNITHIANGVTWKHVTVPPIGEHDNV